MDRPITAFSAFGEALPVGKPLTSSSVNLSIGAASVRTGAALSTTENIVARLLASDFCFVNIGDSSVTATTSHMLLAPGQEHHFIVNKDQFVSCIRFSSVNDGTLSITPLENAQ
jgi:hypothetical protein